MAILFAWLSGNATTWAQLNAQSGESNQGLSPISLNEQVRVIPQGGFVELTVGSETKKFGVSIMHNEGWTAPNAPIGPPLTFQDADADRIELVYDIPGNRRFHLRVKAIHGVPGAVVLGELENLGKSPVVEYFYLLHYVCFVEMLDTIRQVQGGGTVYPEWSESILNEERDLARHPNWVAIDESGKPRRSLFGIQMNHPGLMNVCFHDPAVQEAALRQIKKLLELGYDGVFVDLCFSTPECYGDTFAGHKHVSGKTNTDMYFACLDAIYKTVKEFDKDRLVVMNGALDSNFQRADAVMWESAIYAPDNATRLQSRAELVLRGRKYAGAVKSGKILFQLSYCGGKAGDSWKRLLFTYTYGRIFGFTWSDYTEYFDMDREKALTLYTLDLGKPLADGVEITNGVWRRDFEQGTVLWNADTVELPAVLEIEAEGAVTNFVDGKLLEVQDRRLTIAMPEESGAILLYTRPSTQPPH